MYLVHRNNWGNFAGRLTKTNKAGIDTQVAILGHKRDFHSVHMRAGLSRLGVDAFILDSEDFGEQLTLTWRSDGLPAQLTVEDEPRRHFSEIHAIFWRRIREPNPQIVEWEQALSANTNRAMSLLNTLSGQRGIRWVNSIESGQLHRTLPRKLTLAKLLGSRIPKTIISNNARDVLAFCQSLPTALLRHDVSGCMYEVLHEELLEQKRVDCALSSSSMTTFSKPASPMTVQEYIPGTTIRSYVIGDKVFSAEIYAETINSGDDSTSRIQPLRLPEKLIQLSRKLCRGLRMQWSAIDWRRDFNGNYYFIEADASPPFYHFEQQTGYPITDSIIELLV